jgi:hypothetical protein
MKPNATGARAFTMDQFVERALLGLRQLDEQFEKEEAEAPEGQSKERIRKLRETIKLKEIIETVHNSKTDSRDVSVLVIKLLDKIARELPLVESRLKEYVNPFRSDIERRRGEKNFFGS